MFKKICVITTTMFILLLAALFPSTVSAAEEETVFDRCVYNGSTYYIDSRDNAVYCVCGDGTSEYVCGSAGGLYILDGRLYVSSLEGKSAKVIRIIDTDLLYTEYVDISSGPIDSLFSLKSSSPMKNDFASSSAANEEAIFTFLVNEMNLNNAAAAGVIANIYCESNFNPNIYGDSGTSYGICQWHNGRFTALKNFCAANGLDYTSITGQLKYLQHELETSYKTRVLSKLRAVSNDAKGAFNAAYAWCYYFEIPAGYNTGVSDTRGTLAETKYWPKYALRSNFSVKYTIQYNANGGTGTTASTSHSGSTATALAANGFSRTGYTFIGWNTNKNASTALYAAGQNVKDLTVVNGSVVTLYAIWKPINYCVKFDPVGGSGTMAAEQMSYGTAKALTANAFSKPGYSFAGWNTDKSANIMYTNGQNVVNLSSTANAVITLYAVWKPVVYKIDYDANGGTGTMAQTAQTYGTPVQLTANAYKRTGFTFTGWSREPGASAIYTDKQSIDKLSTVNGAVVKLYAAWRPVSYTVIYDPNGGIGSIPSISCKYDISVSLAENAYSYPGHMFIGWSLDKNTSSASYRENQSVRNLTEQDGAVVRLYAVWLRDPNAVFYTVKYDANGGQGTVANTPFIYGTAGNLAENVFTRPGAEYLGWSTDKNAVSPMYQSGQKVKNLTHSNDSVITMYAVWRAFPYTVKYNANGGSGSMPDSSFLCGTAQSLRKNTFVKNGYTLIGWSIDKNASSAAYKDGQIVVDLTLTENGVVELYSVWKANNYYITYDSNGGSGSMEQSVISYDTSASLRKCTFDHAGHTLLGWSTDPNASVPMYTDGQSIKNLKSTDGAVIKLYAVWKTNSYSVKFSSSGGTGTTPVGFTLKYGEVRTLETPSLIMPGYEFAGWTTVPNGVSVRYTDMQQISNLSGADGAVVTLYAVWSPLEYDVIFDGNGGMTLSGEKEIADTHISGRLKELLPNRFSRDGYAFLGWGTNSDSDTPVFTDRQSVIDILTENSGSMRLYALWKPCTYAIIYNANGGKSSGSGDTFYSIHRYGESCPLSQNTFINNGKRFIGWGLHAGDSVPVYTDCQEISNLSSKDGVSITLYAIWA